MKDQEPHKLDVPLFQLVWPLILIGLVSWWLIDSAWVILIPEILLAAYIWFVLRIARRNRRPGQEQK